MMKKFAIGTLIITASSMALPAFACDMHGGGGWRLGNASANWQSYNPQSYTTDPSLLDEKSGAALVSQLPPKKTNPSFSNAANRAAILAKSRLAKKASADTPKSPKDTLVKKKPL